MHIEALILKHAMGEESKSKVAADYFNTQKGIEFRVSLIEMGHYQQQIPIEIENTIGHGILKNALTPKRSKAIDMRFF